MAFGRLGAGGFGRMGLRAITARLSSLSSLLLRDASSHLLLRSGSNVLLLGH